MKKRIVGILVALLVVGSALATSGVISYFVLQALEASATAPAPVDPSPHYCPCCDPQGNPAPALENS